MAQIEIDKVFDKSIQGAVKRLEEEQKAAEEPEQVRAADPRFFDVLKPPKEQPSPPPSPPPSPLIIPAPEPFTMGFNEGFASLSNEDKFEFTQSYPTFFSRGKMKTDKGIEKAGLQRGIDTEMRTAAKQFLASKLGFKEPTKPKRGRPSLSINV